MSYVSKKKKKKDKRFTQCKDYSPKLRLEINKNGNFTLKTSNGCLKSTFRKYRKGLFLIKIRLNFYLSCTKTIDYLSMFQKVW